MALKQIMLQRKITNKKEMLNSLREKDAEFQKREKDLETAIEEAKTEEEQQVGLIDTGEDATGEIVGTQFPILERRTRIRLFGMV